MEKVKISIWIFSAMLISIFGRAHPELNDKSRMIDEISNVVSVEQDIAIDKVWVDHPVGFGLLTQQNRQYNACYNSTQKNRVVEQRNLNESESELFFVIPVLFYIDVVTRVRFDAGSGIHLKICQI